MRWSNILFNYERLESNIFQMHYDILVIELILSNREIKQIIYAGAQTHGKRIPLRTQSLLHEIADALDEEGESDLFFIMVKIVAECWAFSGPVIADLLATLPPDHHESLDPYTASNAAYILKDALECKDLKNFSTPWPPRKVIPIGRPNA